MLKSIDKNTLNLTLLTLSLIHIFSKYGILNPLIVRPRPEGFYEVISGHRRKYAAMELKYTKVQMCIRDSNKETVKRGN